MPKGPLVNISTKNVSACYNYIAESCVCYNKVVHDSLRECCGLNLKST